MTRPTRGRVSRPAVRRALPRTLLALIALTVAPSAASAQGVGPAAGGFVAGAAAGTAISAGIMAAAARSEVYLWNPGDLVGWLGIPIAFGAFGGAVQGGIASERLGPAVFLSATAGLAGAGLGYLLARQVWDDGQDGWAGALIGGGTGVLAGWILGTAMGGSTTVVIPATSMTWLQIPIGGTR